MKFSKLNSCQFAANFRSRFCFLCVFACVSNERHIHAEQTHAYIQTDTDTHEALDNALVLSGKALIK